MAMDHSGVVAVSERILTDGAVDDILCLGLLLGLRTAVYGPAEKRNHGSAIPLDAHCRVATEHGF